MAIISTDELQTDTLKKILEALEISFSKELGLEDFYDNQTSWVIPEIGISSENTTSTEDLLDFVETITNTQDIKSAYSSLFLEIEKRDAKAKEAPRPQEPEKTTPDKESIEQLQQEQTKREKVREELTSRSKQEIEDAIQRQKELKNIVVTPSEEIHTVSLSDTEREQLFNLKQAVKADPATVEETISKSLVQKQITPETVTKTAHSITENIISLPDYQSVSDIPAVFPVMHPASPIVTITDTNNETLKTLIPDIRTREALTEYAQTISLALDAERAINFSGTVNAFGSENIASIFYGDDQITKFQIPENQEEVKDEGIEINPEEIYNQGKKINEIWQRVTNGSATAEEVVANSSTFITPYIPAVNPQLAVKSSSLLLKAMPVAGASYGIKKGVLISQWVNRPLLTASNQMFTQQLLLSSSVLNQAVASSVLMTKPTELILGKFTLGFYKSGADKAIGISFGKTFAGIAKGSTSQGINVAYAGVSFGNKYLGIGFAQKGVGLVAQKISSSAVPKVIASGFFSKVGQAIATVSTFLGSMAPIVGHLIGAFFGWVLGKIIEKINWKKVKENFLPAIAIGGGLLIGGPIGIALTIGGGLIAFNIARKTLGFGLMMAKLGGVLGGIAVAIAMPFIIFLLILPPIVAFFMFIINSGAYIVPPSSFISLTGADNPYILVVKNATPSKISNPSSKTKVTYTVSIKALKSTLTNIKIVSSKCKVISNNKNTVCPVENIPKIDSELSVSPTNDYSFSFESEYGSLYKDSLIYDSITISADAVDEKNIITTGSASVCIGECPTSCVEVSDVSQKWPSSLRSNAEISLGKLSSEYTGFMSKVCGGGQKIKMCYAPSRIASGYFAWHTHNTNNDGCDVYFNEKGIGGGDYNDALFLLTHELTHHIQDIDGSETAKYLVSGGWIPELIGKGFCSYTSTGIYYTEAMAEAAGLYVSIPSWGKCVSDYRNMYPKNYIFAQGFMK